MIERPLLFSAPMVLALLGRRKTQTRRLLKQPKRKDGAKIIPELLRDIGGGCPHGDVGDRIWVRETIHLTERWSDGVQDRARSAYCADDAPTSLDKWGWQRDVLPSIHCPRALSRITLDITSVRLEQLQDISAEDAIAEGLMEVGGLGEPLYHVPLVTDFWNDPRAAFQELWEYVNGPESWQANPWVWRLEFKQVVAPKCEVS